jgi:hypothetical protein
LISVIASDARLKTSKIYISFEFLTSTQIYKERNPLFLWKRARVDTSRLLMSTFCANIFLALGKINLFPTFSSFFISWMCRFSLFPAVARETTTGTIQTFYLIQNSYI